MKTEEIQALFSDAQAIFEQQLPKKSIRVQRKKQLPKETVKQPIQNPALSKRKSEKDSVQT